jgi:hexosaminidase
MRVPVGLLVVLLAGGAVGAARAETLAAVPQLVPAPVSMAAVEGESFALNPGTQIAVALGSAAAMPVAEQLAAILRPSTGYPLPVVSGAAGAGDIGLALSGSTSLGGEGYQLDVTSGGVQLQALAPAGLFYGVQTLRQLLPPWVESATVQAGPWAAPAVHITDYPRYPYRGVMLDIARHFEPPSAVKRLIDGASAFKVNVLHLHVSDDQGFRIAINGRPELTDIGSQFSVNNDPGGHWSQAEYTDVVNYAAAHYMTVVPEVDSPGHNNAIIMSYNTGPTPPYPVYPDINCSNKHPPVWNLTGAVGYSALCPDSPNTWDIMTDIIGQLSSLSPGPYYHLGGDEVPATLLTAPQYDGFIDRESSIITALGKAPMGWADISSAGFAPSDSPSAVAQFWSNGSPTGTGGDTARVAVQKGMKVVMSPANHTYLDMKYNSTTPLGQTWACSTGCDVMSFYNWGTTAPTGDLATYIPARGSLPAVTDANIIGLEGPIWTETLVNIQDVEFMTFPRLPVLAELGWSPVAGRSFNEFATRLAAQGARWMLKGTNFYASSQVPWRIDLTARTINTNQAQINRSVATVATPGVSSSQLVATIDWGDLFISPGTLSGDAGTSSRINGLYAVNGIHQYLGEGRFNAVVTVRNGTSSASVSFTVVVDTTAPTTTASLSPGPVNGKYQNPTTVTLNASDGSGSGVDRTEYRLDAGAWTTYAGPFQVTGAGSHTLEFRSTDAAGNTETTKSVSFEMGPPTAVSVVRFAAHRRGASVVVSWRTANETDLLGFELFRTTPTGHHARVKRSLIPARLSGRSLGARYVVVVAAARATRLPSYRLRLVMLGGKRVWYPIEAAIR